MPEKSNMNRVQQEAKREKVQDERINRKTVQQEKSSI